MSQFLLATLVRMNKKALQYIKAVNFVKPQKPGLHILQTKPHTSM